MRILFLNSAPENHWDDRDCWLWKMATALREHGHQVWCCGRPNSLFLQHCQQSGLPVHALPIHSDVSPITITRLALFFRSHHIDVVVGNFTKDVRLAGLAGRLGGGPAVVAFHGLPLIKDNWRYRLTYARLVDAVLVNAQAIRQAYQQIEWLSAERVHVVLPGIEPASSRFLSGAAIREKFELPHDNPVVGQIGYLGYPKQPFIFLDVAKRLLESWPQAIFLMMGNGPMREAVLQYAFDLNILDHLYVFTNGDDAPLLLQLCDVVLFTPEVEGIPFSLLQAMALGKAVLAFDVGGFSEVIDPDIDGILVPVNDIFQMTQRTQELLLAPDIRQRLGNAARQKIEKNFSFEKSIRTFESYLKDIVARKKGG